jgi:hypothetical protein
MVVEQKVDFRDVSNFNSVSITDYGELFIEQGDDEGLEIEANGRVLGKITTHIYNHRLHIGLSSWKVRMILPEQPRIVYHLRVKDLKSLSISGFITAHAQKLAAEELDLRVDGYSSLTVDEIKVESLALGVSGSSTVTLNGQVRQEEITLNGASILAAKELHGQVAVLKVSGSSKASVWADKRITAQVSGSGCVEYQGNPRIMESLSEEGKIVALQSSI